MSVLDRFAGPRDDVTDPPVRRAFLLFALSSGIVAWMIHLVGGSLLVPAACDHGIPWSIDVLTGVTAAICLLGVFAGARIHRRAGGSDDSRSQGYRLLAYVAVTSNLISTALVVGEGAMHIWVSSCR